MIVNKLEDIFNFKDKSIIYNIKRTDEINTILVDYINEQQSLAALIVNALHSKWVVKNQDKRL